MYFHITYFHITYFPHYIFSCYTCITLERLMYTWPLWISLLDNYNGILFCWLVQLGLETCYIKLIVKLASSWSALQAFGSPATKRWPPIPPTKTKHQLKHQKPKEIYKNLSFKTATVDRSNIWQASLEDNVHAEQKGIGWVGVLWTAVWDTHLSAMLSSCKVMASENITLRG